MELEVSPEQALYEWNLPPVTLISYARTPHNRPASFDHSYQHCEYHNHQHAQRPCDSEHNRAGRSERARDKGELGAEVTSQAWWRAGGLK